MTSPTGLAGEHARTFLAGQHGTLVCDDYSGYKAGIEQGITEIGCAAHSRRKLFELYANHSSQVAGPPMPYFAALHEIERDATVLGAEERRKIRQCRAKPVCDALYEWMVPPRNLVSESSEIKKALD